MFRPDSLAAARPGTLDGPVLNVFRPDGLLHLDADASRLIYVMRGQLIVECEGSRWIVRRDRGFWLPAGSRAHVIPDTAAMAAAVRLPPSILRSTGTVVVSALLRAALQKLMTLCERDPTHTREARHLLAVMGDEVAHLPDEPTLAPIPDDTRLRTLAVKLQEPEGLHMTLQACGRHVGVSGRTLSRLVRQETGLSFGRWRRRLHLAVAISRLAGGESVGRVAQETGYDSPSAFIAMFRRAIGMTPLRYVEQLRARNNASAAPSRTSVLGLTVAALEDWTWLTLFAG